MKVQSFQPSHYPSDEPTTYCRNKKIKKQFHIQTFLLYLGTLLGPPRSIEFVWVTKDLLLWRLRRINVEWFHGLKRESDGVKICQRKIKGKRSRWRVRRWDCSSECTGDPEKKENNGLSGLVLLCASLSSPSLFFFFALNTGAEIVRANLWRSRWSTANPFNTSTDPFHAPGGLC